MFACPTHNRADVRELDLSEHVCWLVKVEDFKLLRGILNVSGNNLVIAAPGSIEHPFNLRNDISPIGFIRVGKVDLDDL